LETAERLRAFDPTFVSVIGGAGGSIRRNTIGVVSSTWSPLRFAALRRYTTWVWT